MLDFIIENYTMYTPNNYSLKLSMNLNTLFLKIVILNFKIVAYRKL